MTKNMTIQFPSTRHPEPNSRHLLTTSLVRPQSFSSFNSSPNKINRISGIVEVNLMFWFFRHFFSWGRDGWLCDCQSIIRGQLHRPAHWGWRSSFPAHSHPRLGHRSTEPSGDWLAGQSRAAGESESCVQRQRNPNSRALNQLRF